MEFYQDPVSSRQDFRSPENNPRRLWGNLGCCLLIILMGAVLFWLGNPDRRSRSVRFKESQIMARDIAHGIGQFYADYHRLPLPPGQATESRDLDTDTSLSSGLVNILAEKEPYLEGIKPAKFNETVGPSGNRLPWTRGLFLENNGYGLVDHWGRFYRIRLDTDGDGKILNPNIDEVAEGRTKLPLRVIVWSPGKDGYEETWEDNPRSWE